jgi:hypothetical protein
LIWDDPKNPASAKKMIAPLSPYIWEIVQYGNVWQREFIVSRSRRQLSAQYLFPETKKFSTGPALFLMCGARE